MQQYIALLRGINVGGHTVKMDRLRALFEELGLENVATFIASGNVIFESTARKGDALERKIEKHLLESLGYGVETFIRTTAELAKVAEYEPFSKGERTEGSSLYIMFLHDPPSPTVRKKLQELRSETDDFHVHGREVYWLCRTKLSESPLFAKGLVEKALGKPATSRNVNTVMKMAAKYPAG